MESKHTWKYPRRVCIDFDETITDRGAYSGVPVPQKRVREALSKLQSEGFTIAIYSCRNNPEIHNQTELMVEMRRLLEEWDIPYDEIIEEPKPLSWKIVDDRAIEHKGDWGDTLGKLLDAAEKEKEILAPKREQ